MLIILLLQQMFFFKFGELNHSKLQINGNGAMSYTTLEKFGARSVVHID